MKKISVLLTDDHTVVREGLKALLTVEPDIVVVAEAQTGRESLLLVKQHRPDVVVMDVALPLLNGIEATRQILKDFPTTRVIVLSSYSDDAYVHEAFDAGAVGYLAKQTAADDLLKAIRQASKTTPYLSASIAQRLSRMPSQGSRTKPGAKLTTREREVLQMIAEGFANKQIAGELAISIKTVEKHRQAAMDKLRIHDVAGLTRYAIAHGMVESQPILKNLES